MGRSPGRSRGVREPRWCGGVSPGRLAPPMSGRRSRKARNRKQESSAGSPETAPSALGAGLALAFALSGIAGLVYELIWTRYLALLVGHSAFAQVLVLAVFLGGTAIGSLLVAARSRSLERPLHAYALVE